MNKWRIEIYNPKSRSLGPDLVIESGFASVEAGGILKYFEVDNICNYIPLATGTRVRVIYIGPK